MTTSPRASIWSPGRLGVTIGSVSLVFLAAIETLAITTVMPVIAADLHGEVLYAVAFASALATSVIGMVGAGIWNDLSGPRAPLVTAVALFMLGLVISGVAPDMYTFVIGRLVQGLGAGAQIVSLYVLVARVYPTALHGAVFAAFAAAWVVPSMIGPFLAGAVAEFGHWRWIFLGVVVLTALAFLLVWSQLRGVSLRSSEAGATPRPDRSTILNRMLLALLVASAAVGAGFSAEAPITAGWIMAIACLVVIGFAIRPLVPGGTLRARRGLPSVILMRGLVGGAFFAAETYIPKLLIDRFEFGPTTAGLALTLAALTWTLGSFTQGRYGDRIGSTRIVVASLVLMGVGLAGLLFVAALESLPWLVVIAWGLAGGGMGFVYPRLSVLTLAYSDRSNEGFNSAALSISESSASAATIAVAGLAFLTLPVAGSGYSTVFVVSAILLVACLIPGLRLNREGRAGRATAGG